MAEQGPPPAGDGQSRWDAMAEAIDSIILTINPLRARLIEEGYSPEAAEQITVVVFTKIWREGRQ